MANPEWFYNEMIRRFASYLAKHSNSKLYDNISTSDISLLKDYILLKKWYGISEDWFYFYAGCAMQDVVQSIDNNDGYTACMVSIEQFIEFIGLKEKEQC